MFRHCLKSMLVLSCAFQLNAAPIQAGDVLEVRLADLKPTQAVIAHDQVNYKLASYRNDSKKLVEDFCEMSGWGKKVKLKAEPSLLQTETYQCLGKEKGKKQKKSAMNTVVLGPDQQLYLTDGHHGFSALYDYVGAELKVSVLVTDVFDKAQHQSANKPDFLHQLVAQGLSWPKDANGKALLAQQWPKQLGRAALHNDPYRGAAYFLQGGVWKKPKPALPFVEFYWADYLRQQPELTFPGYKSAAALVQWLERIHAHMLGLKATTSISHGFTAAQLGWTGKADYQRLDQLLCAADKPGRLGLSLHMRGMVLSCGPQIFESELLLDMGLQQLPTATDTEGQVQALIEIPAGQVAKWQQSKSQPLKLEWELKDGKPRKVNYLPYPANYGIVPSTLYPVAKGGDGDPLDVLVLGPALDQGSVVQVRLIGLMRMKDQGEGDDKLLAVPLGADYQQVHSIESLRAVYPGADQVLKLWFENYKGQPQQISVEGFAPAKEALQLVKDYSL